MHAPKRQAEKILNQMVQEVNQSLSTTSRVTLEHLLTEWLRFCEGKALSAKTLYDYRWHVTHRVIPALGSTPIDELTARDIDAYYSTLREQGVSPASIRHSHTVIRPALAQAVRWGWLERNVAMLATPPVASSAPVVAPSVSELRLIIEAMEKSNPQFAAIVILAALTGARRGELLALRWSDIDLTTGVVSIQGNLTYTSTTGTVLGPTKTKQNRKVILGQVGIQLVQNQITILQEAAEMLELKLVGNPWLFFGEVDGSKPLHPDSISSAFRRIIRKLGIEGIRFHSLRHFTASQLLAAGVNVVTVSGRLGHSNASETLGRYAHALEDRDREAGETMDKVLTTKGETEETNDIKSAGQRSIT
ncbi:MAG: tyrosine-type recombinase/integrase [Ferrimicrobium sp.]